MKFTKEFFINYFKVLLLAALASVLATKFILNKEVPSLLNLIPLLALITALLFGAMVLVEKRKRNR